MILIIRFQSNFLLQIVFHLYTRQKVRIFLFFHIIVRSIPSKSMKKTLLFHDTFLMKWWAERMNIEIAKILEADIATAYWSPHCYDPRSMGFQGKIIETNPNFKKGMIGFLKMKWSFFRARKILKNYDIVIFSNEAISGIWGVKRGVVSYYYAHSISRHLFDLADEYLKKVPRYAKIPYIMMAWILKKLYIIELRRVDHIFVNSRKNQERMSKWIGRDDAEMLFPPVDTEHFSPTRTRNILLDTHADVNLVTDGYFLSFSRLTHAKRIDTIIEAFKGLPTKNLVVIFWEEDSQREEFLQLAQVSPWDSPKNTWIVSEKYPNIFFFSLENNHDLPDFIRAATATLAVSKNEDFWMVAIESNACGTPVIATDEWWYQEIITPWKNGLFLEKNIPIASAIQRLIENTPEKTWITMRESSVLSAEKYSLKHLQERLINIIKE